ncbi:kinase-like domain-containing protein [Gymnopilus junonius]|uniref:non-specific serine/threonine protein kinase n=1 Tax=Gymnopilus junonius TaxID=109634 RepID=A0A9P5NPQ9_GYMJU|nr:kinase-like domain-containing protein [Gymnopilus junonius]
MTTTAENHQFSPEKLGEYTVIQDIAEGTFGKVKMATHTITGHKVAMKYISKAVIQREKTKTRVKREFEYMRTLQHPHIIKLYEVISTPTDIIFVLEYAGGELFNYIVANGRMDEPRARRFFQQIISGIEYSHRLKIVHRDLKPENVLLDDDLNVKIADFGLSNEISDGDFLTTSCGSPNYAAPEVIRGGVYAGPEIDVWSSGVILYVMLCGRLPFEDDDVQVLFSKISQGNFHMPPYLSTDAKNLISSMLAVDPVKRITVPEITQHPFFTTDLPRYLTPLPPPPGPVLGMLSSLVTPPKQLDFEIIEGLGRIEEDVVEELANSMVGVDKDEVWECLRRDDGVQGNAVKVAYMLLRDKKRLGKDLAEFAEAERDAQLAAMDPRNAISPAVLSPVGAVELEENPFEVEFNAEYESDDQESDELDFISPPLPSSSLPTSPSSLNNNNSGGPPQFAVLNSSLPEQLPEQHHLTSYVSAKRSRGERSEGGAGSGTTSHSQSHSAHREKKHKTKWHFGIRSRSPPMEVMLEIYRTLRTLGMEWKEKKSLGGLGGVRAREARAAMARGEVVGSPSANGIANGTVNGSANGSSNPPRVVERTPHLDGSGPVDLKAASSIYHVETRARVQDVVVLMNLQLYMVDSINYLVDFHHKKTYKASTEPGAGRWDMAVFDPVFTAQESGAYIGSGLGGLGSGSDSGRSIKDGVVGAQAPGQGGSGMVGSREDEVVSPFVFMDVACRLILELAGGGE